MRCDVLFLGVICTAALCGSSGCVCNAKGRNAGTDVSVAPEEVTREAQRLPRHLREKFETTAGRQELESALVDKKLLVREARRRGIAGRSEIQRQVQDLEERLIVQALLSDEEKATGPVSEADLRSYFDSRKDEFVQSERVRVARILARLPPNAPAPDRVHARQRAESFADRLKRGEPFAKVAHDGDGPERVRDGDLGFLVRGQVEDAAQAREAFALQRVGAVSPVFQSQEGFEVLQLLDRRAAGTPSFEEVRADLAGRMAPRRQREIFERLLRKLRQEAQDNSSMDAGP